MVTVLNFSGRPNGNCRGIAELIAEFVPAGSGIVIKNVRDIAPCGDCDYECFGENKKCPHIGDGVWDIYDAVCSSSSAFYIVPNYFGYPNANFFIFNERSQCYFQNHSDLTARYLNTNKKFIVVSNTDNDNFLKVFKGHVGKDVDPSILFLAAKKFGKVSLDGDLAGLEQVRIYLKDFESGEIQASVSL